MITAEAQKNALDVIYGVHEAWQQQSNVGAACRKGCADCCTERVTMTSLEGQRVYAFLSLSDDPHTAIWQERILALAARASRMILPTFNELALAYRSGRGEHTHSQDQTFQSMPCPFLQDGQCLVYPVRPFVCRSFTSKVRCSSSEGVAAEVDPVQLTVTTVFLQLIEHLDFRGFWGTLAPIMAELVRRNGAAANGMDVHDLHAAGLRPTQPIPGFLIPTEEHTVVSPLLVQAMVAEVAPGLSLSGLLKAITSAASRK